MSRDTLERKQKIVDEINSLLTVYNDDYNQFVALGKTIGADKLMLVLEELGGQKPHIPTAESFHATLAREYRNNMIRHKFHPTQYGYQQLASEYSGFMGLPGLTERHVRTIVHAQRKQYKRKPESYRPVKVHNDTHRTVLDRAQKYGTSIHVMMDTIVLLALGNEDVVKQLNKIFGEQLKMEMSA